MLEAFQPKTLEPDTASEADFLVVAAQRFLDRSEFGLDLDHGERPRRLVESEQVNRPAFAENRIRDLDRRIPRVQPKLGHGPADELSVTLVERPIQVATSPADFQLTPRVECRKDPPNPPKVQRVEVPSFEQRDRRLRDFRRRGQVGLPPAAPPAQRPNDQSDASVVHLEILATRPYHGRIRAFRGCSTDPGSMRDTVRRSRPAEH